MKENLISLLLLSLLLINSCTGDPEQFVISGTLPDGTGRLLYLYEMTSTKYLTVDSALIDDEGIFELHGSTAELKYYTLQFTDVNSVNLLAGPGDMIEISGKANDLPGTYRVSGSEDSEKIRQLSYQLNNTIEQIYELSTVFNDSSESTHFLKIKDSLDARYEEILGAQKEFTYAFIRSNQNSLASLMALYQQIGPRRYLLDPMEDFEYYSMIDSSLRIHYPGSEAVKELHRQVVELKTQYSYLQQSELLLGIGMEAPEVALPAPRGDTVTLSSLRGQLVLLDFWASWCPPCREENPNLVKLYRQYADRGFEIYQVSLDKSRSAWLKAIEDDSLEWIHVSDLKMWESVVVSIYGLQGIPMSFLLDEEGRILDKNLRGVLLEEKLADYFKNN